MKLLVLCDSTGNIQSVAVPNPELPGKLQLEVEGGPTAPDLEVDESEIRREDLLGQEGAELHRAKDILKTAPALFAAELDRRHR